MAKPAVPAVNPNRQMFLKLKRTLAKLRHVQKLYEEASEESAEFRAQVIEHVQTIDAMRAQLKTQNQESAGKAVVPRIRRLSRQADVWPTVMGPNEVLLLTETRNGVEYAFVARDQETADWVMTQVPNGSDLWFEWLMRQSVKERAP